MPMMRRGPLEQYSTEWVLRQAAANDTSGSLEFHTARPITIYLRGGRVCHAVAGVPAGGLQLSDDDAHPTDEAAARRHVVALLATAVDAREGWYYHDPLGHHDQSSPWRWETAALLLDARVRGHDRDALGRWGSERVALRDRPASLGPITITTDGWAVVRGLAATDDPAALRSDLGWTAARLVSALEELAGSGAVTAPATPPTTAPTPTPTPASAGSPEPAGLRTPSRTVAPLTGSPATVTVPPALDDRRSALRRLISVLKPA